MTSAFIDGRRFLYAANFSKGRVDVYDNAFHRVKLRGNEGHDHFDPVDFNEDQYSNGNEPFVDDRLPRDYVPFNVQAIGNDIVVTYVLHRKGQQFETDRSGPWICGYLHLIGQASASARAW